MTEVKEHGNWGHGLRPGTSHDINCGACQAERTRYDCGHGPDAPGRTGRAITPDGKTMCYACADAAERDAMARADAYTGYVSQDRRTFTTWPGGMLARVTSYRVSARHWTPTGGMYRLRYVRATAPDGSTWHGSGSDAWDVITLRRDAGSSAARA